MPRRPQKHEILLGLSLIAGAFALYQASGLRLETDLTQLLPVDAPAAAEYQSYAEKFGGFERVFILLSPAGGRTGEATEGTTASISRGDLGLAADLWAERLTESPEIAAVRTGIEESDLEFLATFVAPNAPLLLEGDDTEWLNDVEERLQPEAIRRRAAWLRQRAVSPLGLYDAAIAAADPLGFTEDLPAFELKRSSLPIDSMTGSFVSSDGRTALLIATPTRSEIDPEGGRALRSALDATFEALQSETGFSLDYEAVGGPLYAAEDESLLRQDLRWSIAGSAIGCTLLLVVAFRSIRIPLIALSSLVFGIVFTAGILKVGLGSVTGIGVGFSAVLLGLGIDYCIHGAARYRDALSTATSRRAALSETIRRSGAGIVASALTTAAAFAVLGFAHFRPLRELGFLIAAGVLCILVSTATVGGPLLLIFGPKNARETESSPHTNRSTGLWSAMGVIVDITARWASGRGLACLSILTLLTAISFWGVRSLTIDPNLKVFRSTAHTAHAAERSLLEEFGVGLETIHVVVSGSSLSEAFAQAAELRNLIDKISGGAAEVSAPSDLLVDPVEAEGRLGALSDLDFPKIASDLDQALRAEGVNPRFFEQGIAALGDLGRGEIPSQPGESDLPEWLSGSIDRSGDQVSIALQVQAPPEFWPTGPPLEFVTEIHDELPGSQVASITRVGAEMRTLATRDLRVLGFLAAAVVLIVVLISFRGDPRLSLLAVLPVTLGSIWSIGLWSALGRPLDLVTLAVLPIILGVGIDDGLHVLHAWKSDPEAGMVGALRESGRALVLTTLTTAIAFASLLATSVPGLRNAGALVSLGVICCLGATLIALPVLEPIVAPNRFSSPPTEETV